MASLQNSYAREVREGLGWGATWLPSMRVQVGDVGTFMDGVFVKGTDLALLKIPFSTEASSHPVDLNFSSQRGVSITTKAAGETSAAFQGVLAAHAGIAVSFERKAGVVMSLTGLDGERVRDRPALEAELQRRLNGGGGWQESFAVVVERLAARSATILLEHGRHKSRVSSTSGPSRRRRSARITRRWRRSRVRRPDVSAAGC